MLQRLAPGSYDLVLNQKNIGSVVREITGALIWHAKLSDDPPSEKRPHPLSRIDHTFGTLDAVREVAWRRADHG